jgi:phosphoglucosamine mutase
MGKLFGTDGVRGIVGTELTATLAFKIGASTARVLKNNDKKLTFLIGSDTRVSKDILKCALASGIMSENADVIDLGVIPTPAISYLTKKYHATGGFVISASHNPSEYNGIKVFNSEGFKLADEIEDEIESIILNDFEANNEPNKVGTYLLKESAKEDYVNFLINTVEQIDYSRLHIGVDTANGAAYETAKMLFDKLNVQYEIINNIPDGLNINNNCGSTHIEGLKKLVIEKKLDCGVAFDGDADRCLLIDNNGELVDGDKIMAIYGKYLKENNKLKNNTIVGTVMSNLGFVKFCEKENINFVATKVGDRYVLENMLANDYIIGGEQSGHIIFKELANTGDGELTAIQMLKVVVNSNKTLAELSKMMDVYPQVLKNVNVSREGKEHYLENQNINKCIKNVEEKLHGEGRVLVRPSGTENLIRVMLEGKNIKEIDKYCDEIVMVIKKELN